MTRYHGSCHCGAVQFDVEGLDLENAATCNCSICGRTGALMLFVPEGKLENVVGREQMTDYQFASARTQPWRHRPRKARRRSRWERRLETPACSV